MSKTTFAGMKLKVDTSVNTFDFEYNGAKYPINVLKYLPVSDKEDLVQVALQKSYLNGVCNEIKLDMYFNLYLVYLYTDIGFTDKQKENPEDTYDKLQCSGLIDQVIAHMDQDEYKHLLDYLESNRNSIDADNRSAKGIFEGIINDLPVKMQEVSNIIDQNKDKFQNVIQLAEKNGIDNDKPTGQK